MFDFIMVSNRSAEKRINEIFQKFLIYPKTKELMSNFYAVWIEE